jgi:hypothetical protein
MQMQIMQTIIDLEKYIHLSNHPHLIMQSLHKFTASKGKEGHSQMLLETLFKAGELYKEVI